MSVYSRQDILSDKCSYSARIFMGTLFISARLSNSLKRSAGAALSINQTGGLFFFSRSSRHGAFFVRLSRPLLLFLFAIESAESFIFLHSVEKVVKNLSRPSLFIYQSSRILVCRKYFIYLSTLRNYGNRP